MGVEPIITEELIARQPPEAQAVIRALMARIAEMEAELRELRGQVKGKTPQNSSLPPSTQHPHAKPRREKRKSKKRRGGQLGHQKHERPLIPTEQCDHVQVGTNNPVASSLKSLAVERIAACWLHTQYSEMMLALHADKKMEARF